MTREPPRAGSAEWWKREFKQYCLTLLVVSPIAVVTVAAFDVTAAQVRRLKVAVVVVGAVVIGAVEVVRRRRRR